MSEDRNKTKVDSLNILFLHLLRPLLVPRNRPVLKSTTANSCSVTRKSCFALSR